LAESKKDQIAVVVARGQIVNGTQRAGMIGGDSTAALLRKAGEDERTKAVVLRIDSPGGSGFASEIIRQEILQLKEKGIPVIASMSSVAASGGYWIAAEADEIWAAPTTITGSIGVFGLVMTLEDSAAAIGVHSDSVSTTEIESLNTLEGISDSQARILQRSTENFYQFFITMVAEARNMTPEAVDDVAQGRIWTGRQALERGLVDNLGDFDDAIQAAAKRADLNDYTVNTITQDLSPQQQFFANLMGQTSLSWPFVSNEQNWLIRNVRHVVSESQALQNFNDPKNIYTYCALCVQPR
ncbi:MAG: signal peptide peptidase SppA, partial [Pseudomonadota bacterium]|nr:signal peptide peptidase SppA [Pseudomonadota bacterium]